MANTIEYVRLENDKIDGMQIGNRFIPYVKNYINDWAFSGIYTRREIELVMESSLISENVQFYVEKIADGYKLYIGKTAYEKYQLVLSHQIWGYVNALIKFNIN